MVISKKTRNVYKSTDAPAGVLSIKLCKVICIHLETGHKSYATLEYWQRISIDKPFQTQKDFSESKRGVTLPKRVQSKIPNHMHIFIS